LAQHQQLTGGWPIDRRNHVQQCGLAGPGWAHQREELASRDLDGNFFQRFDLEGIALENLAHIPNLNHLGLGSGICSSSSAHDCPLILILSPSFKFCGPAVMTSSPPLRPETSSPPLLWEMTCTSRIRTLP